MKIVDVIPLSKGINKDTLTYFTAQEISVGAIITVPLRGRTVNALVVSARPAEESRLELKNSAFGFRKISSTISRDLLSVPFMNAARKCADFHIASVGSLLFSVVPKIVLDNAGELKSVKAPERTPTLFHGSILQTTDDERYSKYRSLVREEFAKGRSVFLCLATASEVKKAEKLLEKGIGEYSYVFHPTIKKKDFVTRWNELAVETHPVLIIGTGQFLSVPRQDIGTIILERENSRSYKSQSRPYTDLRHFAEMFAREINATLIFADTLLRTETVWRYRNDEIGEVMPPSLRVQTTAESRIIDMRAGEKEVARGYAPVKIDSNGKITDRVSKKFDPISPELSALIRRAREENEKLVIFGSRRGLAPITVCADCGSVVACKRCHAPVVLHTKNMRKEIDTSKTDHFGERMGTEQVRYFQCHHCGLKRDAMEKCHTCTSWRLQPLGVGIELLEQEIRERFPDHHVFRLDSDSIKTHKQAATLVKKFYETPGGILLGTEMALFYLDQKVENVAVASVDSMFAVPDFRIHEKILSNLIRLRSLAEKNFLIQTRNIDEPVFAFAEKGNLIDFYKQELADREAFDYPPFTVLIKISLSGDRKKVTESMTNLASLLIEYNISVYPAFVSMSRGVYTVHALIKIGRKRWVESGLYEKLRSLPPSYSIAVDPESIL